MATRGPILSLAPLPRESRKWTQSGCFGPTFHEQSQSAPTADPVLSAGMQRLLDALINLLLAAARGLRNAQGGLDRPAFV